MMRWEKVELSTKLREAAEGKNFPGRKGGIFGPGKRWGHTCNSIKGGRFLYVFGGYGKDNCQTNDVHVFDTTKQTWSKPLVKGDPPSPRDSHSCTTVGNNLFVFGGTDGKSPLNDLHIFDTSCNTWISPKVSGEGPDAREGHSAALIDRRLFIFGGCGKSPDHPDEVYYNDLYILDTVSLAWKCAVTSGTPPSARDSHTCSSWKNKIIVLGGEDAADYYLSDVHILDAGTLVWRKLITTGQMLPPRAGHSTVALGRHLFVFGGFTDDRNLFDDLHVLNVENGIWIKMACTGIGPSSRFSVAGDCLDPQKGIIVFIGGCNQSLEALDDMYYLHTGISIENDNNEQRPEKFSMKKELQKKRQENHPPANEPENEKAVLKLEMKLGMVPDFHRSVPLLSSGQEGYMPEKDMLWDAGKQNLPGHGFKSAEEKVFEAKVTDAFHYGYTIETKINGKVLRGILFSYKPSFGNAAQAYFSRKRMGVEGGTVEMKDECNPRMKIARSFNQAGRESDHGKIDEVHGKETASQDSPMETLASDSNNSTLVDARLPQLVQCEERKPELVKAQTPQKSEPSPASLDSKESSPDDKHMVDMEGPCHNPSATSLEMDCSSQKQGESTLVGKE